VAVAYEAAVAGSIPIVKALREGLTANRIEWVAGIINGTTNFVLSKMRDEDVDFAEALAQAQSLGYAEADPTFDIEGIGWLVVGIDMAASGERGIFVTSFEAIFR
jgi:homoserine dehydrogenase